MTETVPVLPHDYVDPEDAWDRIALAIGTGALGGAVAAAALIYLLTRNG